MPVMKSPGQWGNMALVFSRKVSCERKNYNVMPQNYVLIHQNYKQVSMTWCKSCEAHKFFEEWFWCKMSELATREVDTVSEIIASICWMLTQDKSLAKTFGKNYSFRAGKHFSDIEISMYNKIS